MARAWRLTKTKYVATAWDGAGAERNGGRWNSMGVPVVYVSGSLSLALVEALVHLPPGALPAYSAIPVDFDDALATSIDRGTLPKDWNTNPASPSTPSIGDAWAQGAGSVVLRVPSVVVPNEWNALLNPNHPDFVKLVFGSASPFPFDPRLFRRAGTTP